MSFTIWYSTRDFAEYIAKNTVINQLNPRLRELAISDGTAPNSFHTQPDHIKKILYLDSPDFIFELDNEPIFSIEESKEAGTGHNAFQRFARLAASVENGVPALYIYPEAKIIERKKGKKWDGINPLIYHALEQVMQIHNIPALLYHFPSDYKNFASNPDSSPNISSGGLRLDSQHPSCPDRSDSEMQSMFELINEIVNLAISKGVVGSRSQVLSLTSVRNRRNLLLHTFHAKAKGKIPSEMSPLTSTVTVPTQDAIKMISEACGPGYTINGLIPSRKETVLYCVDASYRGDPYPGSLCAIDYISCRSGKSFEERDKNLVLAWGRISGCSTGHYKFNGSSATIEDFFADVQSGERRSILDKCFRSLSPTQIPRYYMQVRYGSMFSKNKQVRIYAYFADAIIFSNGALWREA
jgi:hypothetical protein